MASLEQAQQKGKLCFSCACLALAIALVSESSSVKRQKVSAIVSARCELPCLRRLCSSVKVLAVALVLTSLV